MVVFLLILCPILFIDVILHIFIEDVHLIPLLDVYFLIYTVGKLFLFAIFLISYMPFQLMGYIMGFIAVKVLPFTGMSLYVVINPPHFKVILTSD